MAAVNPYNAFPAFNGRNVPQMLPQTSQPRPLYFLSRNNGLLVPLIPADELPFNVRLQGVPRVMQFDQTYGMQHVGTAPYTGMTFKLECETTLQRSNSQPPAPTHVRSQSNTPINPFKRYLAPDALARQALAQSAANQAAAATSAQATAQRPTSAHETSTNWRTATPPFTSCTNPADKTQSIIDAIVGTTSGAAEAARIGYIPKPTSAPPSGALPDQGKKEYCTYWIRHGECDYIQQGCLYKHEMPDKATLEKIGLRYVPKWWAEKQSVVKLGGVGGGLGEKATVGPLIKSSEWLRKKPVREVGSEDGDESGSESESEASSVRSAGSGKKVAVVPKKPVTSEPAMAPLQPEIKKRTAPEAALKPAKPESHASTPSPFHIRKASTTSDLIDFNFATPLLPTPSSSTPSLTPASSVDSSPRSGQITPATPPQPVNTPISKPTTTTTTRVFVPKGESATHHIAEAKKRERAQHARRGAPVSTVGKVQLLEKQIQEMQKAKHQQGQQQGLAASKNAQPVAAGTGVGGKTGEQQQGAKKGHAKSGCRIRRPAASAPVPMAGKVTILKKEEGEKEA